MNLQDFKYKYSDLMIKVGLYLFTLIFGLILACKLRVPPVIDEVVSIASGAHLLGYDWSESLHAMGGYYFKYGPALLYYPLMRMIEDSYTLYRAMLVLNVVLYAFIPVCAYDILKKYMNKSTLMSALIGFTTGIFPSTVLYTLYARADAMLIFLPWPMLCIILALQKLESAQKGSRAAQMLLLKRIALSVVLGILTGYAYMAHTRGIVLILAVTLSVILIRVICKRKTVEWVSFFATLAAMLLADKKLSAFFYEALYSKYGTSYSSVESYNFEYLKLIFTRSGFASFAKLIVGTAYNVLTSDFGMGGIAVLGGLCLIIMYLRRKSSATEAEIAATIFILMSFLGTFAMSCIYFFPYAHPIYTTENIQRVDWLVYGRYAACSAGPAMMLGLYLLADRDKKGENGNAVWTVTKLISVAGYAAVFFLFMKKVAPAMQGVSSVSRNYIQMCTFLQLGTYGGTTAVFENLSEAMRLAGVLGAAVGAGILLVTLRPVKERTRIVTAGLIVIAASLTITGINYEKIRYSRDVNLYDAICEPANLLEEMKAFASDYPVIIDSTAKDLKHYQYICKEYVIGTEETDSFNATDYFVVAKKKNFKKIYGKKDIYTIDCFNYDDAARDIVYVKGEKLAQILSEAGYLVTKYSGKIK